MLTELLVSVAIVVGLLGVVFELVDPSDGTAAVQTLAADVQQRQRAALAELHRHLLLAGSGPHPGLNGSVAHLRPAVAPALRGMARDRAPGTDRFSVLYAPPREAGALLAGDVISSPATVGLAPAGACALPCGLTERGGGLALVFDAAGRSDLYRILDLTGPAAVLEHVGGGSPFYPAGSFIAPVLVRGFYLDRDAEQLRVHNGAGSDLPFVDGVVELTVRYFGVPQPALPPPAGPFQFSPDRQEISTYRRIRCARMSRSAQKRPPGIRNGWQYRWQYGPERPLNSAGQLASGRPRRIQRRPARVTTPLRR